jgi:hypothetical protein
MNSPGVNSPSRLVVPSDQRLQPDDPASGKLDLRLVVELELALIESGTELVGDPHALMHPPIEVAAVEAVAIAPFVLGAVKREIRLHHHIFRPSSLRGIERDADARGDAKLMALDAKWLPKLFDDPRGKRAGDVRIGDPEHEDGELMAAKPGHQIVRCHCPPEALHHLL